MTTKSLQSLNLNKNEQNAIATVKEDLLGRYGIVGIILFGSVARGEADPESDIDLLILIQHPLTREERHQYITDVICEINLDYGTNISTFVMDERSWTHKPSALLPIRGEIQRDGIPI